MARILCIDYGLKRCGLSVTDPLQIIVQPLTSVKREEISDYLSDYLAREEVVAIVFGQPRHADGSPTTLQPHIAGLERRLKKQYPDLQYHHQDEAYTSLQAEHILRLSNRHSRRSPKHDIDVVSAVLILQRYLGHID